MEKVHKFIVVFLFCLLFQIPCFLLAQEKLPDEFVDIKTVIPNIEIDLKYLGSDNFLGVPVDGYEKDICYITKDAAIALKRVQDELNTLGFGLKVYDAYRPQRAVDHFVRWAKDLSDIKMKRKHYPLVDKKNLFRDSYIASKSSHTRGSTADLTIIKLPQNNRTKKWMFWRKKETRGKELNMGTKFDFFDLRSWPSSTDVSDKQRINRLLLRTLMLKNGFVPYEAEWWHFTLKEEPYPETYFDVPIK